MLLDRKWGGGGGGGKVQRKRGKIGRGNKCAPRGLSRVGTTPSRSGGCRRQNFGNSQRQVRRACLGHSPVLWSDEIGKSRGCHRTGRPFRGRIDQLVHLLCCHPCACSHELPTKCEQLMTTPAELGAYNHLKLTHNTFLPRIRLAWRVFIATGPRPCFRGHVPPINKAHRCISRAKSP
jgi:hypothetical protein